MTVATAHLAFVSYSMRWDRTLLIPWAGSSGKLKVPVAAWHIMHRILGIKITTIHKHCNRNCTHLSLPILPHPLSSCYPLVVQFDGSGDKGVFKLCWFYSWGGAACRWTDFSVRWRQCAEGEWHHPWWSPGRPVFSSLRRSPENPSG